MSFSVQVHRTTFDNGDPFTSKPRGTSAIFEVTPAITVGEAFRVCVPHYIASIELVFASAESSVFKVRLPKTRFEGDGLYEGKEVENPTIEEAAAEFGDNLSNPANL